MKTDILKNYFDDIHKSFEDLGIRKGDILYVSSNIMRPIKQAQTDLDFKDKEGRNIFFNKLIDTLIDIVSERGTILFPMENFDFCKGERYEAKVTKSTVGSLNNFVLENRTDFRRTRHPLYSFMVWGKDADYLVNLDNQESFGENSPFAYLDNNNARQLALDVDMAKGMTFFHYVEQQCKVPYRYHKVFLGEYTDWNGNTEIRAYSQFVRKLEIGYEFKLSDDFLEKEAGLRTIEINGWIASLIDFDAVKKAIAKNLSEGATNIYEFKDYEMPVGKWPDEKIYEVSKLRDYKMIEKEV